jgi:hypothetical protein
VPSRGVTVKVLPVHTDVVIADTAGLGLIVTTTENVDPVQLAVAGVTVYVAVTALLVVLVSVPVIPDPLPANPPVNPEPDGAFHE